MEETTLQTGKGKTARPVGAKRVAKETEKNTANHTRTLTLKSGRGKEKHPAHEDQANHKGDGGEPTTSRDRRRKESRRGKKAKPN